MDPWKRWGLSLDAWDDSVNSGRCPKDDVTTNDCQNERGIYLPFLDEKLNPLPPNPKQAYGDKKVPLGLVPSGALIMMAQAAKTGAEKYGPYNWRETAVEAMTYVHATLRHLYAFLDGESIDPESGAPHIGHALMSLAIIADAISTGMLIDNLPYSGSAGEKLREATKA